MPHSPTTAVGLSDSLTPSNQGAVDRVNRLAYSPAEAAHLIGISRARLYQLLDDGTIPSCKIGRRRLIRHQALLDLLDRLEERGGDAA